MATTSFPLFPKLPAELQLQIWELAAGPGPAIFVVSSHTREPELSPADEKDDGPVQWSGAALLSACRASRDVATRICTYQLLRLCPSQPARCSG